MSRTKINARIHHENRPDQVEILGGRVGWTICQLIKAGETGCTPISHPQPRWSHYVYVARGLGMVIETVEEKHRGQFPGWHARYVLRSKVTVSGPAIRDWFGVESLTGGSPKPDQRPSERAA